MTDVPDRLSTASDAPERGDVLAAVRDAALERGVVDGDDAERHLALAGTAEAVRTGEAVGSTGADDRSNETTTAAESGLLPAALFCVTALRAIDEAADSDDVWRPSPARGAYERAVRDGAALASRRFDLSPAEAAALASVPTASLPTSSADDDRDVF